MRSQLIPVLVLFVFPALYLAWRLRWHEHRMARLLGGTVLGLAILFSLPHEGLDFLYVKRLNLFIAAGVALLLLGRHFRLAGLHQPRRLLTVLTLLAAFTVTVYFNFFSFHGERTFIHLHDVAHYYLGSKYYQEAGYEDLYVAMLRAESDHYGSRFMTEEARDLRTYEITHIAPQLQERSDLVKKGFSEERWRDFTQDVVFFREALKHQYADVLLDHGYNATPVWTLLGSALSRWVPGGGKTGILMLCLLDMVLLALAFTAIHWAFDQRTVLLSMILFCVIFGANFGWTGGAFLRYLWFFSLIVGICCLKKQHHAAAGAFLAFATLVRIFPIFFVLPLAFKAAAKVWRKKVWRKKAWRRETWRQPWLRRQAFFFASFAATALVLVALTGLLPSGYGHWSEFRHQMSLHSANIAPNVVGLTDALAFRPGAKGQVTQEEFNDLKKRRQWIYQGQILLIFLPMVLLAARMARFSTDLGTMAMALPLIHVSLNAAAYYQVFLVVLVLWQRQSMRNLALIFMVEAASFSLLLFEDRDGLLFIYRSVLLLFLYLALYLPALRREWKSL